jgi:hypothetical protein
MKAKLINEGPLKTFALILDKGDEAVGSIEGFARENGIMAAQLTGIGAFSDAILGFFDWETKHYRRIPITEQVEVVSLLGDVALGLDGQPAPRSTCPADTRSGADRVAPAPAQAEGRRERAGAYRSRGIGDVYRASTGGLARGSARKGFEQPSRRHA